MKLLCCLLSCVLLACNPQPGLSKEPASKGFAVVELFTSEGCSSCPPADNLVREIAKKYEGRNVLVLAYHVDYWNRLGWKDQFSSAENTYRQKRYGNIFKLNSVYTPQAVVNGMTEFVGSNRGTMLQAIESSTQPNQQIQLRAEAKDNKQVLIHYETGAIKQGQSVLIALVEKQNFTDVKRGENQGKKLAHINIVRQFETIAKSEGDLQFTLPSKNAADFFIALLQQDDRSGTITGFGTAAID